MYSVHLSNTVIINECHNIKMFYFFCFISSRGAMLLEVNGTSLRNVTLNEAHGVFGALQPGPVRLKVSRHASAEVSKNNTCLVL